MERTPGKHIPRVPQRVMRVQLDRAREAGGPAAGEGGEEGVQEGCLAGLGEDVEGFAVGCVGCVVVCVVVWDGGWGMWDGYDGVRGRGRGRG